MSGSSESQPSTQSSDFEVEAILDKRRFRGHVQYYIKVLDTRDTFKILIVPVIY